MEIFNWADFVDDENCLFSEDCAGSALCIGGFDGPHRGHQSLFDRVRLFSARNSGMKKGAVTFVLPPKASLHKESFGGLLCSVEQKKDFFLKQGFDFVVLIDFTPSVKGTPGAVFVEKLCSCLKMKFLVSGQDFTCGVNADTGIAQLKTLALKKGFVFEVAEQVDSDGLRVSSSALRSAVALGDFDTAEKMLGFHYRLDLRPFLDCISCSNGKTAAVYSFERNACHQILPEKGEFPTKVYFEETQDSEPFAADGLLSMKDGQVNIEVCAEKDRSLSGFLPETVEFIPVIR